MSENTHDLAWVRIPQVFLALNQPQSDRECPLADPKFHGLKGRREVNKRHIVSALWHYHGAIIHVGSWPG